jgi:cation diffusion facilitator CzcD-associated flavoprotein CzcO
VVVASAPAVSELPGIVDFDGPVLDAAAADPAELRSGTTACIGTDQAMVDLVPALVEAGCRVKVFEDRPRLVLPDALVGSGRAGAVAALATGLGEARNAGRALPVPEALCRSVDDEHVRLQRWAGSLHRRRHLHDLWVRRQLTPQPGDARPPLYGDGYYRAIGTGRCQLVSWPIARITSAGVRTCDGLEHRIDAIVVAR